MLTVVEQSTRWPPRKLISLQGPEDAAHRWNVGQTNTIRPPGFQERSDVSTSVRTFASQVFQLFQCNIYLATSGCRSLPLVRHHITLNWRICGHCWFFTQLDSTTTMAAFYRKPCVTLFSFFILVRDGALQANNLIVERLVAAASQTGLNYLDSWQPWKRLNRHRSVKSANKKKKKKWFRVSERGKTFGLVTAKSSIECLVGLKKGRRYKWARVGVGGCFDWHQSSFASEPPIS